MFGQKATMINNKKKNIRGFKFLNDDEKIKL